MESISNIFNIGKGPSSSHTMGPHKASVLFREKYKNAKSFNVTLYGSLALTGKGHLTDIAIESVFKGYNLNLIWKHEFLPFHPNALYFEAFNESGELIGDWTAYSIGGGTITDGTDAFAVKPIYPISTMKEILDWCEQNGRTLWEFVDYYEDKSLWDYLLKVWKTMCKAVERGIDNQGVLPGGLGVQRKASTYYIKANGYKSNLKSRALSFAYSLAVAEENAAGGTIVTAPTCGSCGVLPGVLYLLQKHNDFSDTKIIRALATAGLIANIVKKNASISGAEVGCQGEIGVACSMAAAAANQLFGGSPFQIEYAAEMGLEHHLGLTCDPMNGLVQIPCIERNAFAAGRALDSNLYAALSDGKHTVSLDHVIGVMKCTGHDIPSLYKETSLGGLALIHKKKTL
ncbi:MAG: L-serine ammonia-lyase [Bacteroidetes bacterium GWE2_29_8]|nr:MAG: L-serine ammonia-lyase [Bacteroidetes bacterium GWE2_29_8]OFY17155.1 MAG: L-serine ammonia-lyase [Bacteroidetes bacterium GWF2_29_10]